MSNRDVSLVISRNDLEAAEIYRLAEKHGFHCVDVELPWGRRLQRAHPKLKLDQLKDTVVLVESPAQDVEDWLRANGRTVQIIDHHLYIDFQGQRLDRRKPKSSLEQFADLFGIGLNEEQRLIAANDRGFWPAMIETFEPASQDANAEEKRQAWQECLENVHAIRLRDLAFRFGGDEIRAGEEVERAIEWAGWRGNSGTTSCNRLRPRAGVRSGNNPAPGSRRAPVGDGRCDLHRPLLPARRGSGWTSTVA